MTGAAVAPTVPEAVRDRDLRRLDWRFLRPGLPLDRADDPSPATLRSHASAGHGVYAEWRFPTSSRLVRERLGSAGFDDVELYWPCPGLRRPWFWLPLGSTSAVEFVRMTRLRAHNVVRRAVDIPIRALWHWAAARERLWPICAVARPPGAGLLAGELLSRIEREWSTWGLGERPPRLTWMLLTRGSRTINKVVGLVFAEPDPVPRVIVKLPRVPEASEGLRREAAALATIHTRAPSGLRGAPRVLFCDEQSGCLALGETALAGRPLFSLLTKATYRELAMRAVDWLVDLATPISSATSNSRFVVETMLRDFTLMYGSVVDGAEIRQTERLLAPLFDLPSVPEHRDFSPWNVHVAPDGGLAVYDWESAEPAGLPLNDLVYFLTYLAFFENRAALTPERSLAAYRRLKDPATFTGSVHHDCITRYAELIGLDAEQVRGVHLLAWLIHSRSEYRRLVADTGGPPPAAVLARSLFLRLWRLELRGLHE